MSVKEVVVTESNDQTINFRVPQSMKDELKIIMQYLKYAGYGELFRALYREKAIEVFDSPGFKLWLKMKQDDKEFTLAMLREKARKMGYALQYKGDQKVLEQ